jgi:uncharacterized membrane protein
LRWRRLGRTLQLQEPPPMTAAYVPHPARRTSGDRPVGHVVYGLYLVSPFLLGLPTLIGMAVAYARHEDADDVDRSHFVHQIKTAWASAAWLAAAAIWGGAAAAAGVGETFGNGEFDWGTPAALGVLSIGALIAAPLHFLGATVVGWARLASGRAVGHSRRR